MLSFMYMVCNYDLLWYFEHLVHNIKFWNSNLKVSTITIMRNIPL
jgi:hypothetical protein